MNSEGIFTFYDIFDDFSEFILDDVEHVGLGLEQPCLAFNGLVWPFTALNGLDQVGS